MGLSASMDRISVMVLLWKYIGVLTILNSPFLTVDRWARPTDYDIESFRHQKPP